MTVVKLDPQAVRAVADHLEDVADRLAARRLRIERLLEEAGATSTAPEQIRRFEELVDELCPQIRLRADLVAAADQLTAAGVDPRFVAEMPFGAPEAAWLVRELLSLLSDPRLTSTVQRAAAVRRWAASLDAREWDALLRTAPELVGPVGGMPLERRYQANRLLIQRALAATVAELARLTGSGTERATALRRREQTLRAFLLDPTRQFLLFDNTGDGRVAEVIGTLADADHVAFVVPGITNTLDNFSEQTGHSAQRLYDEAARFSPHSQAAVVAWLGYDAPEVSDAVLPGKAKIGGKALHAFVDGLLLAEPVTTSVVGHSYGSLVTGKALQDGLAVDHVVVIGSPGMGARTAEELGLPAGTDLYAAGAPLDPVAWSEWHGADPSDPRFGGIAFETGPAGSAVYPSGHSSYYAQGSESVRNLALIVTDQEHLVTVEPPTLLDRALIGIDRVQAGAHDLGAKASGAVDAAQAMLPGLGRVGHGVIDTAQAGARLLGKGADWLVDGAQERIDHVGDAAGEITEAAAHARRTR